MTLLMLFSISLEKKMVAHGECLFSIVLHSLALYGEKFKIADINIYILCFIGAHFLRCPKIPSPFIYKSHLNGQRKLTLV